MRGGVVVFPGSNCDHDCFHVMHDVMGWDVDFIWHKETGSLSSYDLIILPGGFSYGDYLRCGAMSGFSPVMKSIKDFAKSGGYILGICNGFQILLETGLLPGAMLKNRSLSFICKNVHIKVEEEDTPFTGLCKKGDILDIPIAHAEGNYYASPEVINELEQNRQIIFRYSSPSGEISDDYNPNGALKNIAGICNKERNVLGMMPHPERVSEKLLGGDNGLILFKSIENLVKV